MTRLYRHYGPGCIDTKICETDVDLSFYDLNYTQSLHANCSCETAEFSSVWNATSSSWDPRFEVEDLLAVFSGGWSRLIQQSYDESDLVTGLEAAGYPDQYPSYAWQCPGGNLSGCSRQPSTWAPFGGVVSQCWAEKIPEECMLSFSLTLGLIVIACNATKFLCMILTVLLHWKPALVTVGDAIQSFIEKPDKTTRGGCLYSSNVMHLLWESVGTSSPASLQQKLLLESRLEKMRRPTYRPEAYQWAKSASLGRWLSCVGL